MSQRLEPRTLKGFKDYLPEEAKLRQKIIDTCREVFELYGFLPLDTPALEYLEILTKKYGEEEKLIYSFEDRGERKVGMRYDLTVPLARVVTQYQNEIKLPFRRYQIASVWRAENPQKGRYREFMQADADVVGVESLSADAECIAMYYEIFSRLGIKNFKILINTREVFEDLGKDLGLTGEQLNKVIRIVDKFESMGGEEAQKLFSEMGLNTEQIEKISKFLNSAPESARFTELKKYLSSLGVPEDAYEFNTKIARGLDYYTGTVFETFVEGTDVGSIGSGGRYDGLVEEFLGKKIPAVGMSVGVDRVLALILESDSQLTTDSLPTTKVLVMNLGAEYTERSLEVLKQLRENGISAQYFYDKKDLDKQFKYAESLGISYGILIGEEELKEDQITVRNLKDRKQEKVGIGEALSKLR